MKRSPGILQEAMEPPQNPWSFKTGPLGLAPHSIPILPYFLLSPTLCSPLLRLISTILQLRGRCCRYSGSSVIVGNIKVAETSLSEHLGWEGRISFAILGCLSALASNFGRSRSSDTGIQIESSSTQ